MGKGTGNVSLLQASQAKIFRGGLKCSTCSSRAQHRTLDGRAPHRGQFFDIPREVCAICFGGVGSTDLDTGTNRRLENAWMFWHQNRAPKHNRYLKECFMDLPANRPRVARKEFGVLGGRQNFCNIPWKPDVTLGAIPVVFCQNGSCTNTYL